MKRKLISKESSELIAQVFKKLSKEEQQLAVDLIANLVCDYYLSRKKGGSQYESKRRKQG